jgi:hypothetical protein
MFSAKNFFESKLQGGVLISPANELFPGNRIQKALVFYAAALKGLYHFYDDPISDFAFVPGVEFFNVQEKSKSGHEFRAGDFVSDIG